MERSRCRLVSIQNECTIRKSGLRTGGKGIAHRLVKCLIYRIECGEIHQGQEVAYRHIQGYLQSVVIQSLDSQFALIHLTCNNLSCILYLSNVAEHIRILRCNSRIYGSLPAEYEIGGRYRIAIAPYCVLAKMEGIHRSVLRKVVAFCNSRNRLSVCIHLHQTVSKICNYSHMFRHIYYS